MTHDFHPYAWTFWLVAGMAAALLTRNPFYLTILLIALGFLFAIIQKRSEHTQGWMHDARSMSWKWFVQLALFLWGFTILFNAATVHAGSHALFSLPATWPVIGGPITLEAIIYGFVTGLNFVTLILLFAIFNSVLGPQTILRMVPGFAYQTGVAISIAISFAPQTLVAWREIREAQRLRGYRAQGLRGLLPLFVSLLSYGLDRAIQLAESMDARGFGGRLRPVSRRHRWMLRLSAILGLLLLLVGLAAKSYFRATPWFGLSLLLAGGILMGLSLWQTGKRVQRSRYRRWRWLPRDGILVGASGLLLGTVLLLAWFNPESLFYYPYPPYPILPDFNPLLGFLFVLPLLPGLLMPPPIPTQTILSHES